MDGFIRTWDFDALDYADATEDSLMHLELDPTKEIKVGENVKV
jgi:hypothetical protein